MVSRIYFLCTCILLINLKTVKGQGDILKDRNAVSVLQRSFAYLYNFEFDKAAGTISTTRNVYINHPAIKIFDCLFVYWKNFPIATHPVEYKKYKDSLVSALKLSNKLLSQDKNNAEKKFYCLLLNIMIARQQAEDGNNFRAVLYVKDAYDYIVDGFKLQNSFSEFYLTTGLYNYYREYYPEEHSWARLPIKMLPKGSKAVGLACLDSAVHKTLFVKIEALMFASYIHLRYENNPKKGLHYAEMLNSQYPGNLFFKQLYIENLIQAGTYEKAVEQLQILSQSKLPYYELSVAVFSGMLAERYYKRISDAEYLYKKAIGLVGEMTYAKENYVSLACLGLGNIYKSQGKTKEADKYYAMACEYCHYVATRRAICK